jgi:hypothetical protein
MVIGEKLQKEKDVHFNFTRFKKHGRKDMGQ